MSGPLDRVRRSNVLFRVPAVLERDRSHHNELGLPQFQAVPK